MSRNATGQAHKQKPTHSLLHPPVRVVVLVLLEDLQVLEIETRGGVHGDGEAQVDGANLGAQGGAVGPLQGQARPQREVLAPHALLELPSVGAGGGGVVRCGVWGQGDGSVASCSAVP